MLNTLHLEIINDVLYTLSGRELNYLCYQTDRQTIFSGVVLIIIHTYRSTTVKLVYL